MESEYTTEGTKSVTLRNTTTVCCFEATYNLGRAADFRWAETLKCLGWGR